MSQSTSAVLRNTVSHPAAVGKKAATGISRPRPVLVSATQLKVRRFSVANREEALRQAILRTG